MDAMARVVRAEASEGGETRQSTWSRVSEKAADASLQSSLQSMAQSADWGPYSWAWNPLTANDLAGPDYATNQEWQQQHKKWCAAGWVMRQCRQAQRQRRRSQDSSWTIWSKTFAQRAGGVSSSASAAAASQPSQGWQPRDVARRCYKRHRRLFRLIFNVHCIQGVSRKCLDQVAL